MITEEFKAKLDEKIAVFMRTQYIASRELDERQLGAAIREALLCGDFQKQVVSDGPGVRQQIVYLPGEQAHRAQMRILDLEEEIEGLREMNRVLSAKLAEQGD